MIPPAPFDHEAEAALLGAALLAPPVLPKVVVDLGLRAEHFASPRHQAVYTAMLALLDRGEVVDPQTVAHELARTRSERDVPVTAQHVDVLAAAPASVGGILGYAHRVLELADLRRKREGALTILRGVGHEDATAIDEGEQMLVSERSQHSTRTAQQLADDLIAFAEAGPVECWPLPWADLTRTFAGGLKRGQFTVLSGHSSHGKSVAVDQMAEAAAKAGARVHIYLTEMTERARGLRFVARHSGLNALRLAQGKVRPEEKYRYVQGVEAFASFGIGMTNASGWTADDIARDVRLRRWDYAIVDIFNELNVGDGQTADYDRAVTVLKTAPIQADCHLVVVAHVNEQRVQAARRPKPTLGDLRSTGMLKNAADNVIFVYREQDDEGALLDEGCIYSRKARDGLLCDVPCAYEGGRMRWLAREV